MTISAHQSNGSSLDKGYDWEAMMFDVMRRVKSAQERDSRWVHSWFGGGFSLCLGKKKVQLCFKLLCGLDRRWEVTYVVVNLEKNGKRGCNGDGRWRRNKGGSHSENEGDRTHELRECRDGVVVEEAQWKWGKLDEESEIRFVCGYPLFYRWVNPLFFFCISFLSHMRERICWANMREWDVCFITNGGSKFSLFPFSSHVWVRER